MKKQLQLAIVALHKSGYVQDFTLMGNELFLAQEKTIIAEQDFQIERYYRLYTPEGDPEYLALGIVAISKLVRGILLTRYDYEARSPQLVFRKMKAFAHNAIISYTV